MRLDCRRQLSTGQRSRQDSHQIHRRHAGEADRVGLPAGRHPWRGPGHSRREETGTWLEYFEIDDAATLTLKEIAYEQRGIVANLTFIPGNYVTDGLMEPLIRNGFDVDVPTYFIWEGNTMYLPMRSIKHVLTGIRTHIPRFRVSFDYMAEAVIANTTGDPGITKLVDSFARMGAPWVSGIRDIRALARELRLNLYENFKTSELYRTYWQGRPMTSPIFDFYSVCTVGC